MTDKQIEEMIEAVIKSYIDVSNLYQKTFKRLLKVVAADKAARFIQIEDYLASVVHLETQEDLPFIGEFQKLK